MRDLFLIGWLEFGLDDGLLAIKVYTYHTYVSDEYHDSSFLASTLERCATALRECHVSRHYVWRSLLRQLMVVTHWYDLRCIPVLHGAYYIPNSRFI
jgi:hypothetical protein